MDFSHREIITTILEKGLSLHDKGINNWVLTKIQCLTAIEELQQNNIAILGGDTYLNGQINPNGDSWSVDSQANEGDQEYFERSINAAIKFVSNPIYAKYSFLLVPKQ